MGDGSAGERFGERCYVNGCLADGKIWADPERQSDGHRRRRWVQVFSAI